MICSKVSLANTGNRHLYFMRLLAFLCCSRGSMLAALHSSPFFGCSRTISGTRTLKRIWGTNGFQKMSESGGRNGPARQSSSSTSLSGSFVIDSHLHVWASKEESRSFPYADASQTPPEAIQDVGSAGSLMDQMSQAKVDGALIVQPINHKFDHSYVAHAISSFPNKFKGMLLHDPSLSKEDAVSRLEDLLLQGFVGVRFNPYLWPKKSEKKEEAYDKVMSSDPSGMAVYKRCGELNMAVGIMCFQGLHLHFDDIVELLETYPTTTCILDHFAFTGVSTTQGDDNFQKLLSLAKYPQLCIKISAIFRVAAEEDPFPYNKVKNERFAPLLDAFGADRLMMGTDFPFVTETAGGYKGAVDTVATWCQDTPHAKELIMGGTAERVFGPWYKRDT